MSREEREVSSAGDLVVFEEPGLFDEGSLSGVQVVNDHIGMERSAGIAGPVRMRHVIVVVAAAVKLVHAVGHVEAIGGPVIVRSGSESIVVLNSRTEVCARRIVGTIKGCSMMLHGIRLLMPAFRLPAPGLHVIIAASLMTAGVPGVLRNTT